MPRETVASRDTFRTEGGKKFTIDVRKFTEFLRAHGIRPGKQLGEYLREEVRIPDEWATASVYTSGGGSKTLLDFGAKGRAVTVQAPRKPRGPSLRKLLDSLVDQVWKDTANASGAGDYFLMSDSGYGPVSADEAVEDFPSWLSGISGDTSTNWEYAIEGTKAGAIWDKLSLALDTGIHQPVQGYEADDLNEGAIRQQLRELYADAWYDGILKDWERILKNPRRLQELKDMKEPQRNASQRKSAGVEQEVGYVQKDSFGGVERSEKILVTFDGQAFRVKKFTQITSPQTMQRGPWKESPHDTKVVKDGGDMVKSVKTLAKRYGFRPGTLQDFEWEEVGTGLPFHMGLNKRNATKAMKMWMAAG
tara:strand:- start:1101 stop:2189 length:1089 start_codon:yes stop_codon:yes gene_type:complete